MNFIADFHVHSKFSRATAKNLDLENIYMAAQIKGISVVGTGDFTHPGWFEEIKTKLVSTGDGLYELKDSLRKDCDVNIPETCRAETRFILATEISNIYKKDGQTRKNHNLVILPDIQTAQRFNYKLEKIGNIHSDGRPILGLDARNLLEMVLEVSEKGCLVPAHIWTPWFSVLGSKSGFDSIQDCFEDLTPYIFAVETGLSSDPAMNWQVSSLEGFTLISNSDAHSPGNLGREANRFDTDRTYNGLLEALKNRESSGFLGTYEFFPEEGKYHLDGHRKCNQRLWPEETRRQKGVCSKCGKPLTLGVLYRVEELADRFPAVRPKTAPPYITSIPLADIIAETLNIGTKTKKVQQYYIQIIEALGPELKILHEVDSEKIKKIGIPLLEEAVLRMRRNEILISPGYDGEFGKIKIFKPEERLKQKGQKLLFKTISTKEEGQQKKQILTFSNPPINKHQKLINDKKTPDWSNRQRLNKEQQAAVDFGDGPLMIVAGPGTGKTHTLTQRIVHLVSYRGVSPDNILAITFTRKASAEMKERLESVLPINATVPLVTTFHRLGHMILSDLNRDAIKTIISKEEQKFFLKEAMRRVENRGFHSIKKPQRMLQEIIEAKQQLLEPNDGFEMMDLPEERKYFLWTYRIYLALLKSQGLYDYEDLIFGLLKELKTNPSTRKKYQEKYKYVFIDEYQDVNQAQHQIVQILAEPQNNICIIGDPNQSIYGFRGSSAKFFKRFAEEYPECTAIHLNRNYRSTETILTASAQVVNKYHNNAPIDASDRKWLFKNRVYSKKTGEKQVIILTVTNEKSEAVTVGKTIEKLIGGSGYHYMDFNQNPSQDNRKTFSDFAVLFRTTRQSKIFSEVFSKAGIPFQVVSRDTIYFQKGLGELISFLRITEGVGSLADFDRIKSLVSPKITKKNMEKITSWLLDNHLTLNELLFNSKRVPLNILDDRGITALKTFFEQILRLRSTSIDLALADRIKLLAKKTGIIKQIETDPRSEADFNHLIAWAETETGQPREILNKISLQTDTDTFIPRAEKVALMTMHAAKGLEFSVVFIAGCENGYIPMEPIKNDLIDIDEERRLFYVAMTRAKDMLFLTRSRNRYIHGKLQQRTVSPFIEDIEKKLRAEKKETYKKKAAKKQKQLDLFK